jgi:hypothetical protein
MLAAEMTDNAAPRHSGQWKKGQSGNPAGMPRGTRHRATMLAEKLMEDDAENIVRAVVSAAKAGDPTAMRLCIERLIPVRKGRAVVFDLPAIETAADVASALGAIAGAMAAGELTPDEAGAVVLAGIRRGNLCGIAVELDAKGLAAKIAPVRIGGRLSQARPAFWESVAEA